MKFGLSDDQLRQVQDVLAKFPIVTEALVFGSRAMGNYKEASDVDLALKGEVSASLARDVKDSLEETKLPFFFDVIAYGTIDAPKLKEHIDTYGVLVYRAGWKTSKLGDHVLINAQNVDKNYPFAEIEYLDTGSITEGRIDSLQHFSLTDAPSRAKRIVKDNDIVLSMVRPIQRHYGFLRKVKPNTVASTGFVVLTSKKSIDPYFLYSFLIQDEITDYLDMVAEGSTSAYPAFTPDIVENLAVNLPPLPEQNAAAALLLSMDEKIDLLHCQNKVLEGMAAALWRSIFIEGAERSWAKKKLGDLGEFKNGINYSRNENGDSEYSILNVRDIVASKYLSEREFEKVHIDKDKARPYLLQQEDIIIVRSASPGESLLVLGEVRDLIYSGFSIRFRCYEKRHSFLVFQFLQSYKKEMDIFSDGTTLKNINQGILGGIDLVVPGTQAISAFNSEAATIYKKILLNQKQIDNLSRLRDTLRPKLMSGEARIRS